MLTKLIFFFMPQLTPFYFVNQVSLVFLLVLVSLYIVSKYIIPRWLALFTTRLSVTKF